MSEFTLRKEKSRGGSDRALNALGLSVLIFVLTHFSYAQAEKSWKSFSNRAGWTVSYPPDWAVTSCKSCSVPTAAEVFVDFLPPRGRAFGTVIVEHLAPKPTATTVDAWFANIKQTANLNPLLSAHRFALNGLPALRVRYRNPSGGGYEMERCTSSPEHRHLQSISAIEAQGLTLETSGNDPTYLQMVKTFRVEH